MENYLSFSSDEEKLENLKKVRKELNDLANIEHILASCFIVKGIHDEILELIEEYKSFTLVFIPEQDKNDGWNIWLNFKNNNNMEDDLLYNIQDILGDQFSSSQIENYINTNPFEIKIKKETYNKEKLEKFIQDNFLTKEQKTLLAYNQLNKEVENNKLTKTKKKKI